MEETHLSRLNGAAQLWSSAAWICALSPLPAGAPLGMVTADRRGWQDGGGVPRHAALVLPPLECRCSSVRKRSPYGCDFLSFSFFCRTFFSSCFNSREEGPVLHLTITPPSPPACLPGCAVRWRELLSFWSECVNAMRSGTSHSAPASALMLVVS